MRCDEGPASVRRTSVLVADDDASMRDALSCLLDEAGYRVTAAAVDGVEAIEAARATDPDIVILDLRMPRLDGAQTALRLKSLRPGRPVIIFSAYDDPGLREGATAADAYLVKGCSAAELFDAIELLVRAPS
jgi:CheY-like chemotaxis protein